MILANKSNVSSIYFLQEMEGFKNNKKNPIPQATYEAEESEGESDEEEDDE